MPYTSSDNTNSTPIKGIGFFAMFSTADFNYELPEKLIAQHAVTASESRRLLVYKDSRIQHHRVHNLPNLIPSNALLVLNNTKVIPSRIRAKLPTGGHLEVLLNRPSDSSQSTWNALARPLKKLLKYDQLELGQGLTMKICGKTAGPIPMVEIKFNKSQEKVLNWLEKNGFIPLPPYINRHNERPAWQSDDLNSYQTCYAKHAGSVAAPTAGLHFNQGLIEKLQDKGIDFTEVTLHVGAGTFLPVKTQAISAHQMHSERYLVTSSCQEKIQKFKVDGRPIFAVGTTSFRAIETFFNKPDLDADRWHETDLFIFPKNKAHIYKSKIFNGIMTNFHQPQSTLFMLICALIGYDEAKAMYSEAITHKYKFFSYGDSSLLCWH